MRIKLYNDLGSVTFGGKSSEGTSFFIRAAEGFALAERTFSTASYSGYPGITTTGISVNARTITIAADMKVDAGYQQTYERLLSILNKGGYLEISENNIRRKIQWICNSFVPGEKNKAYFSFTIQLTCDYPYFSDTRDTEIYIFRRTDKIIGDVTSLGATPTVFTERISRSSIFYAGTAEAAPVFIIDVLSEESGEIKITNHTYNETIQFNCTGSRGEQITIDAGKPAVYNSSGADLIDYISDDTYLDCFHLHPGINDIEALSLNDNAQISIKCIYNCKYIGAVI